MKPSVPQTTYSKAQAAKANYTPATGISKSPAGKAPLTPEQITAKLNALEQQVNNLLQRVHEDSAGNIHITTDGNISLHAQELVFEANNKASMSVGLGSSVELNSAGDAIITATAKAKINASAQVLFSSATVRMDAAFVETTGVFKANIVQATTVTATTYTPGAGNIW